MPLDMPILLAFLFKPALLLKLMLSRLMILSTGEVDGAFIELKPIDAAAAGAGAADEAPKSPNASFIPPLLAAAAGAGAGAADEAPKPPNASFIPPLLAAAAGAGAGAADEAPKPPNASFIPPLLA